MLSGTMVERGMSGTLCLRVRPKRSRAYCSLLSSSSPPQDVGEVATLAEREFFGEQVRSRNQHARPLKTLLLIHLSTPRV